MSEIKEGVWTLGELTLMMITDEIVVVALSEFASVDQQGRIYTQLKEQLGVSRCIFVKGGLSYQALSECKPLVDLIDERIAKVVGNAIRS